MRYSAVFQQKLLIVFNKSMMFCILRTIEYFITKKLEQTTNTWLFNFYLSWDFLKCLKTSFLNATFSFICYGLWIVRSKRSITPPLLSLEITFDSLPNWKHFTQSGNIGYSFIFSVSLGLITPPLSFQFCDQVSFWLSV